MSRTWRNWARGLLAGPGAIALTIVVMAGMTQWLPSGSAGIDNLVIPIVLAPLIWAALFFHACLDRRLARIALIAAALFAIHGGLVARVFVGHAPARAAAR